MKMDDGEILREYKAAKKKNLQIEILADQNLVSKREMARWLNEHGVHVDNRLLRRRNDKVKEEENEPENMDEPVTETESDEKGDDKPFVTEQITAGDPETAKSSMEVTEDIIRKVFFDFLGEELSYDGNRACIAGAYEMARMIIDVLRGENGGGRVETAESSETL